MGRGLDQTSTETPSKLNYSDRHILYNFRRTRSPYKIRLIKWEGVEGCKLSVTWVMPGVRLTDKGLSPKCEYTTSEERCQIERGQRESLIHHPVAVDGDDRY